MKYKKEIWQEFSFPEIIDYQEGPSILKKDFSSHGIPLIRLAGMDDGVSLLNGCNYLKPELVKRKYEHFKIKAGDIILSTSATIGKTAVVDEEAEGSIIYTGLIRMRPQSTLLCNSYLRIMLQSPGFTDQIFSMGVGSVMKHFGPTHLKRILINLPPLEEQKRIAALFQSIDAAIEQAEAQEKNLLDLKKKLLNELFNGKLNFGNYLQPNDYKTTSFESIAKHISERIEPGNSTAEIYVGLEHLDSDNLRIERTGKPADVKGTKLKVYNDDIIFGKRRAYLRKVAVSHFDGICSAHSMVLRAIKENIEKEFLPFFMQSDYFMDRAVQISEGSLSPTIKWKVLAKQEFHLPKKEKQNILVTLFKQIDNTIFEISSFKTNLKNLKQNLLDEILG